LRMLPAERREISPKTKNFEILKLGNWEIGKLGNFFNS
jgi:hypothetical protein